MRRFPLVLSLVAAAALCLLAGLGVWQLRRLEWKQRLIAHIAALRQAPGRPIAGALSEVARGVDVDFTRVAAVCGAAKPAPAIFRYALREGRVGWRLLGACPLAAPPYDGILLDRGLVDALAGRMAPRPVDVPPARAVVGILRAPGSRPLIDSAAAVRQGGIVTVRLIDTDTLRAVGALAGLARPAPLLLAVEAERPPATALTPAALPVDIPNNHFVYALTWFALAGILLWFYGAMLLGRMRDR